MLVKVEDDPAPEQPPKAGAGAEAEEDCPPLSPSDDDDDEEETDSGGDGAGGGGAPPLKKGPWTPEEDKRLKDYVEAHGEGNWNQVQRNAGLNRCGKSCRLRWANHLRPDLKKGPFDAQEVEKIIQLHMSWGNKWAKMAACLPGRTDNEIKNYWNTRLKRHQRAGLPIYPEHLVSRVLNQDMNCYTPGESRSKKQSNELQPDNTLDLNDLLTFNHINYDEHKLNLPGPNPVIPVNPLKRHMSTGCIESDYRGSLTCVQIPGEPEKTGCSTDFSYGMTTESQLAPLGSAIVSGHPIFDGNLYASGTIQSPMKMELPSFQSPYYGRSIDWLYACPSGSPGQPDTFIESPGPVSLKSESIYAQNTGVEQILDAIVHNGDGLDNHTKTRGVFEVPVPPLSYNQVSQLNAHPMRHSSSCLLDDCDLEGCPFGEIQASNPPLSSDAIFSVSKYYPDTRLSDKYPPSWPDSGMPDASLEASLLNEGSIFSKDPSIIQTWDSMFDEDSPREANLSTAGHGLDATWKSMPDASNMPDFPDP